MLKNESVFIFHVHTTASIDGRITPERLVEYCRVNGIGIVAVCDHNTIAGALKAAQIAKGDPIVIIGEEIRTEQGEIIGLFLKRPVEKGLEINAAIDAIKDQQGLVCLPHPGETFRRSAVSKATAMENVNQVDIVEAFNSRSILSRDNAWARKFAQKFKKPMIFGCDAHSISELKGAVFKVSKFTNPDEMMESLKNLQLISKKKTGLMLQAISVLTRYIRKISN